MVSLEKKLNKWQLVIGDSYQQPAIFFFKISKEYVLFAKTVPRSLRLFETRSHLFFIE